MLKSIRLTALIGMALCIAIPVCIAQTKILRGKVTDLKDGAPIAGATIRADKSDFATVTNADGSFQFTSPQNATRLLITFVGYKTLEVPITADLSNI